MKIDINDPRITAFALGELTGSDATEIARAMRADPRIRAAVDEVRETASLLHETLGGGKVQMLTTAQRAAVRSAGEGPVIADIASAKAPFWKHPAVAGIGVAAVVALGIFLTNQQQGGSQTQVVEGDDPAWDWSQVDLENLTTPAVVEGADVAATDTPARTVAAAISEDTPSFRRELQKRINEQNIKTPLKLPELEEQGWEVVAGKEPTTLAVPLASGAASWPLLQRYIKEQNTLPPRQAVRIEEMVNHFSYKTPTMLKGGGLAADMELCNTPWNPATMLIAVHVSAQAQAGTSARATLTLNGERVQRVRLLGYAGIKTHGAAPLPSAGPRHISKSHGNYVIYEIEPVTGGSEMDDADGLAPLATLHLGENPADTLALGGRSAGSWLTASADLRFASTVAATGMLLSSASATGELDAARLKSLLEVLKTKDLESTPRERKTALKLLHQAAELLTKRDQPQGY